MIAFEQCYIYNSLGAYNEETPDVSVEIKEINRDGDYLTLHDTSGYTHIINLTKVFAVTYK
ncbi:hypothetical protein SAMN02745163_03414 [Clostridium cavendishii DSM 21758]|uniref:Uncharacterized protein n=1 Tax=Clostridium cavendishii DSM 21758 TaxID=1121302 RepID=A0A1M6QIY5_9CLOT|nr:hypothetical protein [Clostridium cavendishii]SHK20023.1 hypothetical protein SAMN02745163_03414 [Clostridium cavendishii DSM 21758]